MSSSTGSAPAQQVPAWKRLGLKLKQPSAASEPATGHQSFGHPSSTTQSATKRKLDAPQPTNSSQVAKRPRKDETTADRNGQLKRQKSVTFADTPSKSTYTTGIPKTPAKPTKQSKAKSKGPAKKEKPQVPTDLKPALEYLRLWKTARDSWKFNKNHQSNLIKHVFDADGIPASDIGTFYDYIQDLKGFVRMRLRDAAQETRDQDQSEGAKAFPEGTKDLEATQQRYETVLARYLQSQPVGSKRKGFTEVDYLSDSDDEEIIIRRLVKRMRAELVLDELSDSDDTETSTTSSSHTITASDNGTTTAGAEKRVKLNDGTGKRRRKLRVNLDESDTSSSESESDSDSDSDSDSGSDTSSSGNSSSSSGESEDGGPVRSYRRPGEEDSSDSPSSSEETSSDDDSSEDGSDDD
ncbi:hypothetical protein ACJ41O_004972 [Fusarium nematophilum]